MDWSTWLKTHKTSYDSTWEERFVNDVLVNVETLDPKTLSTQVPFTDIGGRSRRMDFTIVDGAVKVALEVDGWDKTGAGHGMTKPEFADFLVRQNALQAQGYAVLRFSNTYFRDHPDDCVEAIELTLQDMRAKNAVAETGLGVPEPLNDEQRQRVDLVMVQNAKELEAQLADLDERLVRLEGTTKTRLLVVAGTILVAAIVAFVLISPADQSTDAATAVACPDATSWQDAEDYIDDSLVIWGPVVGTFYDKNGSGNTYLDIGLPYPNQEMLRVVIFPAERLKFDTPPEDEYAGQTLCISGTVGRFLDGPPQIIVNSPGQLVSR